MRKLWHRTFIGFSGCGSGILQGDRSIGLCSISVVSAVLSSALPCLPHSPRVEYGTGRYRTRYLGSHGRPAWARELHLRCTTIVLYLMDSCTVFIANLHWMSAVHGLLALGYSNSLRLLPLMIQRKDNTILLSPSVQLVLDRSWLSHSLLHAVMCKCSIRCPLTSAGHFSHPALTDPPGFPIDGYHTLTSTIFRGV